MITYQLLPFYKQRCVYFLPGANCGLAQEPGDLHPSAVCAWASDTGPGLSALICHREGWDAESASAWEQLGGLGGKCFQWVSRVSGFIWTPGARMMALGKEGLSRGAPLLLRAWQATWGSHHHH